MGRGPTRLRNKATPYRAVLAAKHLAVLCTHNPYTATHASLGRRSAWYAQHQHEAVGVRLSCEGACHPAQLGTGAQQEMHWTEHLAHRHFNHDSFCIPYFNVAVSSKKQHTLCGNTAAANPKIFIPLVNRCSIPCCCCCCYCCCRHRHHPPLLLPQSWAPPTLQGG